MPNIHTAKAQYELDVLRSTGGRKNVWHHFTDAPNTLYRHLAGQAFELLDNRIADVADLGTLSEWQRKQEEIRKTLLDIVGPFPEKTPLNAKVLRVVRKKGFRVEHIVYESQPGFYVTSSLFVPEGLKKGDRAPAILFCSGHTDIAYRSQKEHYQPLILNLVSKGFVVLAIDPVGQGERLQYYDRDAGKSIIGGSTGEHSYSGVQAFIAGSSQAMYMTWDGIRGVDYLLERVEVDPDRLGITGCSGGGTQTAYIAALDQRIRVAVPSCYITNFSRLLESIGPQDAEQNLYHGIKRGIDHADFLLVRAPKPIMIMSTSEDFFSIQGARETAAEVSRIYEVYGAGENFEMVEDSGPHGTTRKNRESMYAFFQKHLNNPGDPREVNLELLSADEMMVTPTGQVSSFLGGQSVFSLNRAFTEGLVAQLDVSRSDLRDHISVALKSAVELSGYREPADVDEPVFTGRVERDNYSIEKYFIRGEGDCVIPYLLMRPDKPSGKGLIYLHPSGKSAEAGTGGQMEWFAGKGFTVLAPDLIGIGETGGKYSGSNSAWFASILIARSITGIRAGDVSRLVRLLNKQPGIEAVYGLAQKEISPVLLHAAAFDPSIERVALVEPYCSYRSIVMNRFYDQAFVQGTVAGALQAYDLPDLAGSLAPRKLLIAGVTDGSGNPASREGIMADMEVIEAIYDHRDSRSNLKISYGKVSGPLEDLFLGWIK